VTSILLGFILNFDQSNVLKDIRMLEPWSGRASPSLKSSATWPRGRGHQSEGEQYFPGFGAFVYATGQEVPCLKDAKKRKAHYSGKRKRHTAKKQLKVNENGLIMQRTNPTKGRMYDYGILRAIRRSFQESDHRLDFSLLRPITTSAVAHAGGPRLGLKRLRCARFVGSRFASAVWENTNHGARRGRREAPPVNYHVIFIYH